MSMTVAFVTLLTRLPYGFALFRTCVPNTQFVLNGRVCFCDNTGHWNEHNCRSVERRQLCQPGQIVWKDCSQCICQDNGQLLCTNNACAEESTTSINQQKLGKGATCTPFRSYYVNCSLCLCPASGRTSDARCAKDTSCSIKTPPTNFSSKNNVCIPNVIYLFPCIHCQCSNEGKFVSSQCVNTCPKRQHIATRSTRCTPRTFYRIECNVCQCPTNGQPDYDLCTHAICNSKSKFSSLSYLKNQTRVCYPNHFTKPRCIYCKCRAGGIVNNNACLELDCIQSNDFKYNNNKKCRSGQMVPMCTECFCPRNGQINPKYCTEDCSFQRKLTVLENILKGSSVNQLIDRNAINKIAVGNTCQPRSLYVDRRRYCICPDNGSTDNNLCSSEAEVISDVKAERVTKDVTSIDYNITCEPNSFVEFECNTCYCSKHGKIDPKWCTYDDCDAKQAIQAKQNIPYTPKVIPEESKTCIPGSISKVECNFCICTETGVLNDRACTKNHCQNIKAVQTTKFTCEPLAYYQVDCNTCFCPSDGLKNVAKCTKNQCETNFLRSDVCVPGGLFSDDCNVCVCPSNGNKYDKACTNHTCSDMDTPWQKIFKLSQTLLGNPVVNNTTHNLNLCFPGEEFVVGCKLCVCPDMGLREFAACTPMLCDENNQSHQDIQSDPEVSKAVMIRTRRTKCVPRNYTDSSEFQCTPGTMYIIRCKQCYCPYMGNINYFCRSLPLGYYCEQPFPNYNYIPMKVERRIDGGDISNNSTELGSDEEWTTHSHTAYKCNKPGKVADKCYICDCLEKPLVIIEEHCFKNSDDNCTDVTPTFLDKKNKVFI